MSRRRQRDEDEEDYRYEDDRYDDDFIVDDDYSKKSRKKKGFEPTRTIPKRKVGFAYIESEHYQDYSQALRLKADHEQRPIWITKDNLIFLEAFSPLYQQACDFLVAIAEPESRPEFIHSYRLTENSLYAAVAISIDTEAIIKVLNRLCKTDIPKEVISYIRDCTYTFGKAKIVLKDNSFFIESRFPAVLRELLKNPIIKEARIFPAGDVVSGEGFLEALAPNEDKRNLDYTKLALDDLDNDDEMDGLGELQLQNSRLNTVSFMIAQTSVQVVKRTAKEDSKYPLMEEYDFKNDHRNPILTMDLRPSTAIRPYQEKSLSKMFSNGRARSGIIVLPCGAGKSLTGVTAASTVKRSCIVMCINNASVKQWKEQFVMWTNVSVSITIIGDASDR